MNQVSNPHRPPRAPVWLAAVALLLSVASVWWRYRGPEPAAADAEPSSFSAARARSRLAVVLGDERPHPLGSEANLEVRDRLLAELVRLGLQPQVQDAVACRGRGHCRPVSNVIATLDGDDEAVLLAAHYDSVAAGPGAADDGAAVAAILETVRALKHGPVPEHTLILLFSDGEEAGLLGAQAFMAEHPLARRVRVAINLEARGTSGPSLMFETHGPTGPLVAQLSALPRPITSSLFSAVYARMPNDTDFSVFRAHGVVGYNFAFLGGVSRYHTSLDDLAHLDSSSLQHHGDSALGLVRALGSTSLGALQRGGDVVWFDLWGLTVLSWPLASSLPLAATAAAALLALALLVRRREERFGLELGLTVGATLLALLLAVGAGFAVAALAGADAMSLRSAAAPSWVLALAIVASIPSLLLGWRLACSCPDGAPWARLLGVWLPWACGGVVLAALFPEACHLLVAPALALSVMALLAASVPGSRLVFAAATVGCLVAAALWVRLVLALGEAVGPYAHPALTVAVALWVGTCWPLMSSSRR